MMDANAIQVRIGELCHQFRLPTMGVKGGGKVDHLDGLTA